MAWKLDWKRRSIKEDESERLSLVLEPVMGVI